MEGANHPANLGMCGVKTRCSATSSASGSVIEARQSQVPLDYRRAAMPLDGRTHGTLSGQKGPVGRQLVEYGHAECFLEAAAGVYGGGRRTSEGGLGI